MQAYRANSQELLVFSLFELSACFKLTVNVTNVMILLGNVFSSFVNIS